jgi:hypothetical protein
MMHPCFQLLYTRCRFPSIAMMTVSSNLGGALPAEFPPSNHCLSNPSTSTEILSASEVCTSHAVPPKVLVFLLLNYATAEILCIERLVL